MELSFHLMTQNLKKMMRQSQDTPYKHVDQVVEGNNAILITVTCVYKSLLLS